MSNAPALNQKLGATLAIISVAFWGLLPVSSKGLLDTVDAYTLNFYRFVVATILLGVYLGLKGTPPILMKLQPKHYGLMVSAVLGLLVNHVMFMDALQYIPAGSSQIIVQLGPITLLIVSVLLFREAFSLRQWGGTLLFVFGLCLFFNDRLVEIFSFASDYAFGIFYMIAASLIWIFYGLAQKLLVGTVSPVFILLCCYSLGAIVLFPVADIDVILQLNQVQLWLLAACTLTSLIAYICFGESLVHWPASKSSALLAFIPIATLVYENTFTILLPRYISADTLNALSIVGALLVVVGCLVVTRQEKSKVKG
ncbi:MAG: DMT family transporter [Pseudomonadales bacterium]|nr:DMT family transporter [Pseudomonadales bacterium]